MAGNVGTQLAQTSNAIIQKNLNVQPTIKIRPGYLFNVMVSKDMVLPGAYPIN
jgi:type IV secretory pathway VirB10-like protein